MPLLSCCLGKNPALSSSPSLLFVFPHVQVCGLPDMPHASNHNENIFNGPTVSINIINMLLENDNNSDLSYWNGPLACVKLLCSGQVAEAFELFRRF